jgi:membrane complex biogenesis BtpA family protein
MNDLNDKYNQVFDETPIMGMIHLAGPRPSDTAMDEIRVLESEGVDAAIIENYHGTREDVTTTLQRVRYSGIRIKIGVNMLPNHYNDALSLADTYDADFVQVDQVAGSYTSGKLDFDRHAHIRGRFPDIAVLGGVWPKYYRPIEGSILEHDLIDGMNRADAVVVTGAKTGGETPLNKIKEFRKTIGDHPLVVGAGLNLDNAYDQLIIADGGIVGTSLKENGDTRKMIDRRKVRDFMDIVRQVRKDKK